MESFFVFVVFPLAVLAAVGWFGIQIERRVVSEVQGVVDAVVAQLVKVREEIVSRLGEVEAQVVAAGVEDKVDLSGLVAIADALDAIVPDAVKDAEVEGGLEEDVEDLEDVEDDAEDELEAAEEVAEEVSGAEPGDE